MKFGYECDNLNELINNYKIKENKIIVTFLDGSKEERTLTKVEEKLILDQMLNQAKFRSESDMRYNLEKEKTMLTSCLVAITSNMFLDMAALVNDSVGSIIKTIFATLGCVNCVSIIYGGLKYNILNNKLNELEKYDIYLAIYEELEKYKDEIDIYKGLKKQNKININTLDNYTLDEVNMIKDNLYECTSKTKKIGLLKSKEIVPSHNETRKVAL